MNAGHPFLASFRLALSRIVLPCPAPLVIVACIRSASVLRAFSLLALAMLYSRAFGPLASPTGKWSASPRSPRLHYPAAQTRLPTVLCPRAFRPLALPTGKWSASPRSPRLHHPAAQTRLPTVLCPRAFRPLNPRRVCHRALGLCHFGSC